MSVKSGPGDGAGSLQDIPIEILRERFVFNKRTGAFFATSTEGAFILRAAWQGLTPKEIEIALMKAFDVPAENAMSDTERFLLRLGEMHLLPEKETAKQ